MMCRFVWQSTCKRTLPNSVLLEGTAIGESYMHGAILGDGDSILLRSTPLDGAN